MNLQEMEKRIRLQQLEKLGCPECKAKGRDVVMERKATLESNEWSSRAIYQCPKCKNIEERE